MAKVQANRVSKVTSVSQFAKLPHLYGNSRAIWITRCYLPPGRGDLRAPAPARLVLDLATPAGAQKWVTRFWHTFCTYRCNAEVRHVTTQWWNDTAKSLYGRNAQLIIILTIFASSPSSERGEKRALKDGFVRGSGRRKWPCCGQGQRPVNYRPLQRYAAKESETVFYWLKIILLTATLLRW